MHTYRLVAVSLSKRVLRQPATSIITRQVSTTTTSSRFEGGAVPPFSETAVHEEHHRHKDPRLAALKDAEKDLVVFKDLFISQILANKKNQNVSTVHKTDTVYSAIKKMNEMKVGALVVTEDDKPVGMISERDYLNKVILRGYSSKDITVNDIMTHNIVTIPPTFTAGDCMNLMTKGRFRHIPVVDEKEKMIGIVSIGDLVKSVLDQQKETITFLREYIERTY